MGSARAAVASLETSLFRNFIMRSYFSLLCAPLSEAAQRAFASGRNYSPVVRVCAAAAACGGRPAGQRKGRPDAN